MRRPLSDERAKSGELAHLQRLVEVDVEVNALLLEQMDEQHLRVKARVFDALRRKKLLGPFQQTPNRPNLSQCAYLSFS